MEYINTLKEKSNKAIEVLEIKYLALRATGSHPDMLKNVSVEYYGEMTPISQTSNIQAPDALQLIVVPFEPSKEFNKSVVEAISNSDLHLSVVDEGTQLRVPVPPINEEKRIQYAKEASQMAEAAKVSIRNVRQDVLKKAKSDDSLSEDEKKNIEVDVQEIVNNSNKRIEDIKAAKEKELMSV